MITSPNPRQFLPLVLVAILAACTAGSPDNQPPAAAAAARSEAGVEGRNNPLAGTRWRLVRFLSMDDAIGEIRPDDPAVYTMALNADGSVQMQLNCNRASGTWSIDPASDRLSGSFSFGRLATTRAQCPPPSMDERIAADAQWVRGYLLRDGRLNLSLMADGGIYTWEPDGG
jgi:heat shock protein HslJ